jgi:hypothetical protein
MASARRRYASLSIGIKINQHWFSCGAKLTGEHPKQTNKFIYANPFFFPSSWSYDRVNFGWRKTSKQIDAQLYSSSGENVGHHFMETSQAVFDLNNSGKIYATKISSTPAPTGPKDAPWLRLTVTSPSGSYKTITRTQTSGGGPPTATCKSGDQTNASYSATVRPILFSWLMSPHMRIWLESSFAAQYTFS